MTVIVNSPATVDVHRVEGDSGINRLVPFGARFAELPKVVPPCKAVTTSQWISNPNTKEWDYDDD